MKMDKFWGISAFALVCAMLVIACQNPTGQASSVPQQGYGTVRIAFVGEDSRTVFPSKIFDNYVYTFTKQGSQPQVMTPNNGIFTLESGNWNVRVDAYVGAVVPANLAAWSTVAFMLNDSEHKVIPVTLDAKEDEGFGKFTYHIQ